MPTSLFLFWNLIPGYNHVSHGFYKIFKWLVSYMCRLNTAKPQLLILLCHFHLWTKFFRMHKTPASSGNCIYTDNSGKNRSMTHLILFTSIVDGFSQATYFGQNNPSHYLSVHIFTQLENKTPNLVILMSMAICLETSFQPRFSQ